MGKTIDERLQLTEAQEKEALEKAKQITARRKRLEKLKKEEDRKARTRRLIQIGGVVEKVLGRELTENDIPKLTAFLMKQETNGKYFSRALNDSDNDPVTQVSG